MDEVEQKTRKWLADVVIGLNLCPFAKKPEKENRIRCIVSQANNNEVLLAELQDELEYLDATPVETTETTLLILPVQLQDFYDYNDFLDIIDGLLEERAWVGVYQIATFHPSYCFAGVDPDSAENLTNRSPYPIFHIIREASLEAALEHYPDVEAIPDRNIERVKALTLTERQVLFGYLIFTKNQD